MSNVVGSPRNRAVDAEDSLLDPPRKKPRLSQSSHDSEENQLFVEKMNNIADDERANDVAFEVHSNNRSEMIEGIKAMFAAHSDVLANLVYADQKPIDSKNRNHNKKQVGKAVIQIDDAVSIEAFNFIKDFTHCKKPTLQIDNIIDIWFAAQKFNISDLVEMCERKALSVSNVDEFYFIFLEIQKYHPVTLTIFDEIISKLLNSPFVKNNVDFISECDRFAELELNSMKLIFEVVDDHELRYKAFKRYSQLLTISGADNDGWKAYFDANLKEFVDFTKISTHFLVDTIGKDQIVSYETFVNLTKQSVQQPKVERIIHCIDVQGVERGTLYYVKWLGLSYSCCSYVTAANIGDEKMIAEYERWNTLPSDTQKKHLEDADFKQALYGWYQLSESSASHQPAENDRDAQMKAELAAAGTTPDEPQTYKDGHRLRDYQIIGLNWLIQKFYEGSNSVLVDEMSLGNTVQITCFIEHLHRVNNIRGPWLIVTSLSTLYHWKRQIEGWTNLNVVVYHDRDCDRGESSRKIIREHEFYYPNSDRKTAKFNILLTTHEILMTDSDSLAAIKWFFVVFEEGHCPKSKPTQLAKSLDSIDAERRTLLTKTSIPDSLEELFNLLHFLEPKEFTSLQEFNQSNNAEQNDTSPLNTLQSRIQQHILRTER